MFYRTIFVCLVGFGLVKLEKMDPSVIRITFNVKTEQSKGASPFLTCDHREKIEKKIYTVYEGGYFTIFTKYNNSINEILCKAHSAGKNIFTYNKATVGKTEITFTGEKRMGTEWECKILTHRGVGIMQTVVSIPEDGHYIQYSVAYCYMKIHVRQKVAPQTILVNNMELPAVRTDLSQKDVDFIAEYQYADGDVVNVTCINQKSDKILTMEYKMADTMSDNSTMDKLKSSKMIGFTTRLRTGHNNSYMICTHTEYDDYTKVMVRFVKRTKFNNIDITINGMVLPPYLHHAPNNVYRIDYKYVVHKYINVTCEIKRPGLKELSVFDEDFMNNKIDSYKRYKQRDNMNVTINGMVLPPNLLNRGNNHYRIDYSYVSNQIINVKCEVERTDVKLSVIDQVSTNKGSSSIKKKVTTLKKFEMIFYLTSQDTNKKLECATDYLNGTTAENVVIYFTEVVFPIEQYPLHMELPSDGRVMEVYNDYKLNVIFYEYKYGETLQIKCGKLRIREPPAQVLYLELESNKTKENDQSVYNIRTVTRENENTPIVCYLKEESYPAADEPDKVLRMIKVIFRERVLTTTTASSTTTTTTITSTTTSTLEHPARDISSTDITIVEPSGTEEGAWDGKNVMTKIPLIIGCCVVCIIIICASVVIIKLRKRNHSQGGPHNRNYENLQEPTEGSIPAYPPQWENNYAVPVDRRTEDTTYSVPCPPADLYATPTPKSLRNKKQKPLDPTYAVLTVPKNRGQKNMFKETEDPNYSEVYANRPEACYAKVLPKSQRNNAEQDNPYSYVTNDRPCAFAADTEPMYCEPGKARDAEYANLNNSHYANSNPPEYVEPTYCEPQKRIK